jgi:hypothetical protein
MWVFYYKEREKGGMKMVMKLLNKINKSIDPVTKDRISRLVFGGKLVLCVLLIILKYLQPSFNDYVLGLLILVLILARSLDSLNISTPWLTITGADYVKEQVRLKSESAKSSTPPETTNGVSPNA